MLQSEGKQNMLTVKDGRIICPICKGKYMQMIYPDTEARRLPLYCRHCKNTAVVNISGGMCAAVELRIMSECGVRRYVAR